MTVPNDTTKFELAFLIIWILLTTVLLALAAIKKLALPTVIPNSNKLFVFAFAALQVIIFTLTLAALAHDSWSQTGTGSSDTSLGVAESHQYGSRKYHARYTCGNYKGQDNKNLCQTPIAAGAFVLIFGLVAIIVAFVLMIAVVASAVGKEIGMLSPHIPMLANVQWVALQAMMFIWAVSAHDVYRQEGFKVDLGDSWAIIFVTMILAVWAALFYGAGARAAIGSGPAASSQEGSGPAVHAPATA